MIKTKKQMFIVVGAFALILLLGTASYAFFNYTRTGAQNTLGTGRIYFNTDQGNDTLTLTNVFPMTSAQAANANLDTVSVHIQGDTTYFGGEEYQITLVDVVNTANNKTIPIKFNATYTATTSKEIGSAPVSDYFAERGSTTTLYDLTATGEVSEGKEVLKGYVAPEDEIDGTLTISAYLDSSKVIISDTEEGAGVTVSGYTNGTPSSYIGDATVITTSEWNTLTGVNTLSFKIKAEANEGTWLIAPFRGTATQLASSASYYGLENLADAYRYVGSDPDNYVWFNNEQWRIIGVYDGKLKIIRANALTGLTDDQRKYNVDEADGNAWEGSDLQEYLTNTYYPSLSSTAKTMIYENATWYVGASWIPENATTAYTNAKTLLWNGKVGLMATYEYLYAAGNSCSSTEGGSFNSGNPSCASQDWLNASLNDCTLTPGSYSTSIVLRLSSENGNVSAYSVFGPLDIRPVIYLNSTVVITGGNGGFGPSNSYKLG